MLGNMTLWISEMLITSTIGERLWAKVPTKSCNCHTKYVGLHVQYDHGRVYTEQGSPHTGQEWSAPTTTQQFYHHSGLFYHHSQG